MVPRRPVRHALHCLWALLFFFLCGIIWHREAVSEIRRKTGPLSETWFLNELLFFVSGLFVFEPIPIIIHFDDD